MSARWKAFWDDHAQRVGTDEPLRRVLHVQLGRPLRQEAFERITHHVVDRLEIDPEHRVLDLCCGNGLLSAAIGPRCRTLVAVDFCDDLLREVPARTEGKALALQGDAVSVEFRSESFDRVLLASAVQHFEEDDVIHLFRKVARFLRPRGIFLVTDIPDHARMWAFFNNDEREEAYFSQRANGTPILGTWFEKSWVVKLARHAGFSDAIASDQPIDHPYAHYRFDAQCRK